MFAAGAFEAAYPFYRQILRQEQRTSPRMLLRMAFVQEGLGHYPAALYYLSLAQARQPRQRIWHKMAALAQQHRLAGYPDTWRQTLGITFQRYYYRLLQVALALAVGVGTLLLLRRPSRGWWVAFGVYVGVIGLYVNLLGPEAAGLVARPRAALMTGPSAGASWLTTAAAGDRLVISGQQDVWYRVQWQGRDAYIRRNDLLIIN